MAEDSQDNEIISAIEDLDDKTNFDEIKFVNIKEDQFQEYKKLIDKSARFTAMLRMARVFNYLTFSLRSYMDYINDESPVGMRQKFQSFLIANGFIHEGLEAAKQIQSQFTGDKITDNTLGQLLNNEEVTNFTKKLKRIRDKTFHFDQDLIVQPFRYKTFSDRTLMSGNSSKVGDTYFNIVTALEFQYMIGEKATEEDFKKDLIEMLSSSASIVELCIEYLQKFIVETAKNLKIDFEVTNHQE